MEKKNEKKKKKKNTSFSCLGMKQENVIQRKFEDNVPIPKAKSSTLLCC